MDRAKTNKTTFLLLLTAWLLVGMQPLTLQAVAQEELPATDPEAPPVDQGQAIYPEDQQPAQNEDLDRAVEDRPTESGGSSTFQPGSIQLDFADVEIRDVVKAVSKITGKNFILDDRVRGKVTIISPSKVTVKEAYEAFVSALEVKNFTVVEEGKVTKIIPIREAKSAAIPSDPNSELPMGASFITRLIPIQYINANEISLSLKSLVSPNGSITAYGPTNSLIVTDSASNIRRLMKIIAKLDRRGFQEGIEVIPVTYSSASEMAKILNELFKVDQKNAAVPKRRTTRGSQDIEGGQIISKILPDDRTNSLIIVANREGVEKVLSVVRRLDHEMQVEEGKGRIHVHYLENADAEEMASTLGGLTGTGGSFGKKKTNTKTTTTRPGSTSGGDFPVPPIPNMNANRSGGGSVDLFEGDVKISPDSATNALVIVASPQDYEALRPVITKLDIRRRQVFVEAIILELDIERAVDVGIAAHGAHGAGSNNDNVLFGGTVLGGLNSLASPVDVAASNNGNPGGIFGFRGKNIDLGFGSIPLYGAVFKALQTDKVLNILSTPNILTTDNKPAEILVGQNVAVPLQTSLDQQNKPITSFDRRDVGISLKVTPQVNESNYITMDIEQKIETVGTPDSLGQPSFKKRSANTTVVVENEQTIVIGGLISDEENETKNKVPILGDIPLLGWFFQNKVKSKKRNNLMIFITPYIVQDSNDLMNITREKDIQRQRFNRRNRTEEPSGFRDYGVNKRMQIQRKETPASDKGRKGEPTSRLQQTKPGFEEGTAAYSKGYVIDNSKPAGTSQKTGNGISSPFEEIVPPTSE